MEVRENAGEVAVVGERSAWGRTRRPLPGVPTIQPTKPITIYPGSRAPEFILLRAERTAPANL